MQLGEMWFVPYKPGEAPLRYESDCTQLMLWKLAPIHQEQ